MPQVYARSIAQVDVEDDASRPFEIGVAFESLRGRKQDGFVVELPEQTLYCSQHPEVIIDEYNAVAIFRHPRPVTDMKVLKTLPDLNDRL